jgi:aryl-alcohol dehydrogenase-like predicted oxidoreductase
VGWQLANMQHIVELRGWTRFVSMQNQYSLVQREDEREMFGLLADQGVGSIPWSPLAKGWLVRPRGQQTARSDTDSVARWVLPHDDQPIADAVRGVAERRGVPMAQIALAWVLHHPVVSAPIVGATKEQHLTDAVAALDLTLTDGEISALEEPCTPREFSRSPVGVDSHHGPARLYAPLAGRQCGGRELGGEAIVWASRDLR